VNFCVFLQARRFVISRRAKTVDTRSNQGVRIMSSKKLMVIALAVGGALSAGLAQARDVDVQWSVSIGVPVPLPVFRPVVVPVFEPRVIREVVVPVSVQPVPSVYDHAAPRPVYWDRDGDGIPNRYDRVYNPRWDRDGDGIPNRYDRHDGRRDGHHDERFVDHRRFAH
jgi:hypothetical protein